MVIPSSSEKKIIPLTFELRAQDLSSLSSRVPNTELCQQLVLGTFRNQITWCCFLYMDSIRRILIKDKTSKNKQGMMEEPQAESDTE